MAKFSVAGTQVIKDNGTIDWASIKGAPSLTIPLIQQVQTGTVVYQITFTNSARKRTMVTSDTGGNNCNCNC